MNLIIWLLSRALVNLPARLLARFSSTFLSNSPVLLLSRSFQITSLPRFLPKLLIYLFVGFTVCLISTLCETSFADSVQTERPLLAEPTSTPSLPISKIPGSQEPHAQAAPGQDPVAAQNPAAVNLPLPLMQGPPQNRQLPEAKRNLQDLICRTIEQAAADNALPVEFFARLIWQESKFDPNVRSSAGAEGIAQFMPSTASARGLINPYEPVEALHEAASLLHELEKTFGNLGLAAAAYNAGPGAVSRWLAGKGTLAPETIAYVEIVTGRSAWDWASPSPPKWEANEIPKGVPCDQLASLVANTPHSTKDQQARENAAWKPWGVQLAGNWQQGRVLASFEQVRRRFANILGDRPPYVVRGKSGFGIAARYSVRVGENNRQDADRLCDKLEAAGGACVVLRNSH